MKTMSEKTKKKTKKRPSPNRGDIPIVTGKPLEA